MRGDRPSKSVKYLTVSLFTPHARGSTLPLSGLPPLHNVYPACAGIDPHSLRLWPLFWRLPRMRGDRPSAACDSDNTKTFTPHARGSTLPLSGLPPLHNVYPACAGIDPEWIERDDEETRLPRMRGDRPIFLRGCDRSQLFTPHARGSTWFWRLAFA